ncbi:MAG: hypothetical protein WAK17_26330 [Candidatus Nitrosopolaris sp.]
MQTDIYNKIGIFPSKLDEACWLVHLVLLGGDFEELEPSATSTSSGVCQVLRPLQQDTVEEISNGQPGQWIDFNKTNRVYV